MLPDCQSEIGEKELLQHFMEGRPNMAKYYVQSGDRKMVMTAADSQAAALWLVHRSLNDVVTAYDDRAGAEVDARLPWFMA